MLFIDLDKLKIVKEFQYQAYSTELTLSTTDAAAAIKAKAQEACNKLFTETPSIAAHYTINIDAAETAEEDFIGFVNIITMVFVEKMMISKSRKRERRLDVPTKLQCAHIGAGLLKRLVNTQTVADVFNLTITCGDFTYVLIDTKEIEDNE